jgi:hypothetical protein
MLPVGAVLQVLLADNPELPMCVGILMACMVL